MSSDWEDDDIGYSRPPRWTRFEKGQSGNPNGRPKKPKEPAPAIPLLLESQADRALRRELDRTIKITDAKGTKEETMADAVVRAQVTKAAQGHVPAIRDVRRAQRELEKAEAERALLAAQQAEEDAKAKALQREQTFKFVCELKQEQAIAWEHAARQGKAEPDNPWPHPDDITIDNAAQVFSIKGPIDAKQLPQYKYFETLRDQYFVEMILLLRTRNKSKAGFYAGLMSIYEALMPTRWAIGDGFEMLAIAFLQMPLRFLREDLARAERKAKRLMPSILAQPVRQSDWYGAINATMKPVLKPMGYVSCAQFERAWEDTGGNPPWPRSKRSG